MPTLLKRSNGVYYVVSTDHEGRRKWVSTGQRLKSSAIRALAEKAPRSPKVPKSLPIEEFFRDFLEYGQNVYSPENLQVYRRAFRGFIRHIGNVRLNALSQRHVDTFKTKRLGEVSRVTVNIELRSLRAAFYTAVRWNLMSDNPFKHVQQCAIEERTPTYLTREEFETLLKVVNLPWLRDLIIVAAFSGMRRSECVQLRWEDVDFANQAIYVRSHGKIRTKFGKMRMVPINPDVKKALLRRKPLVGSEFVFLAKSRPIDGRHLSRMFKRYVRKAGLNEKLHFHSLRHSFGSWLVQNNASLYQVQKLLGHSNIRVTEMYSHLVPADLRETVNRLTN
jgi:integrase